MFHPLFPAILLAACTLVVYTIFWIGLYKVLTHTPFLAQPPWPGSRRVKVFTSSLTLFIAWMVLLGVLSANGFFADFSRLPPRIPLALLAPLPVVLAIAFSGAGTALLRRIPPQLFILLQSFRVIVEITLWLCVVDKALPIQMSLEGRNFDILSGLLALPVGYYCFIKKSWPSRIALYYNMAGVLLLLNVVVIAALSLPGPLRYFHNEPPNTLVAQFPFIYLPGLLVPLAYTLHIFSLRQWSLLRQPRTAL